MFTARKCENGPDAGKWYTVVVAAGTTRRIGYCARGCVGHPSSEDALAHYLTYQLDREVDLWLERRSASLACEICAEPTTLRARLGRENKLSVLCREHQSTASLRTLFLRRASAAAVAQAT